MTIIRHSRKRKFKNNKMYIRMTQVAAIWFGGMYCVSNLTSSPTAAYFSDSIEESMEIQAGTWWDGSILSFAQLESTDVKSCEPVNLSFQIENKGFTMIGTTSFDVLYNGNPIQSNQILYEIENNQSGNIAVSADQPGTYQIIAEQRPGFNKNYERVAEFSSEAVTVTCPPPPKKEKEDNKQDKENHPEEKTGEEKEPAKEVETTGDTPNQDTSLEVETPQEEPPSEEPAPGEMNTEGKRNESS